MSRDPATATRAVDHDTAERLAGHRLDRRRRYAVINDVLCSLEAWTDTCSGCDGAGCHKCGYQGCRRTSYWLPLEDPCHTPTATPAPATAAVTPSTA